MSSWNVLQKLLIGDNIFAFRFPEDDNEIEFYIKDFTQEIENFF
jgi:hypothetical protein